MGVHLTSDSASSSVKRVEYCSLLLEGIVGINELTYTRGGLNWVPCVCWRCCGRFPTVPSLAEQWLCTHLPSVFLPFLFQLSPAAPLPLPSCSSFSYTMLAFHLISKLGKAYWRVTFVTIMKIYLEFIFVQIKQWNYSGINSDSKTAGCSWFLVILYLYIQLYMNICVCIFIINYCLKEEYHWILNYLQSACRG